jgi:DNA-binding GntR family transcriptional regulator
MDDVLAALGTIRPELNVPTRSARLATHIEQLILDGKLPPGARLVEETIARHLGISRSSLREAVIGLEKSGLVRRDGNTRVIRQLRDRDVAELHEMWTILEAEAVAMACGHASARILASLRRTLELMDEVDDPAAFHRLNLEFHKTLVVPCPNTHLVEAYTSCLNQIRLAGALAFGRPSDMVTSRREHHRIAEAYFARDAHGTRELIRAHLAAGARSVAARSAGQK